MEILSLVIISLLVESVWETLKMVWQEGKLSKDRVGALVVGEVGAFATGLNIFTLVGITINPLVGIILSGILVSRGSSFIHELLSKIEKKPVVG